jgi:predicted nucleic acid-binding protein
MKHYLLDSSFVIDLLTEMSDGEVGPAMRWSDANLTASFWVSPVTYAEVLEGAEDPVVVDRVFRAFRWQTIGRQHAGHVARIQRRSSNRLGENDAWQIAVADLMGASIVGHDPKAFDRLGDRYDDYRRS